MKKPGKNELWQAASLLLCVGVAWMRVDEIGASEFSGGRITGPVFTLFDNGLLVLMLAIPVTFIYRRIAAFAAIVGAALCLPLYLYATAPGPLRSIFKGLYKVSIESSFVWDNWSVAGMLTLAIAVFVSCQTFLAARRKQALTPAGNV